MKERASEGKQREREKGETHRERERERELYTERKRGSGSCPNFLVIPYPNPLFLNVLTHFSFSLNPLGNSLYPVMFDPFFASHATILCFLIIYKIFNFLLAVKFRHKHFRGT